MFSDRYLSFTVAFLLSFATASSVNFTPSASLISPNGTTSNQTVNKPVPRAWKLLPRPWGVITCHPSETTASKSSVQSAIWKLSNYTEPECNDKLITPLLGNSSAVPRAVVVAEHGDAWLRVAVRQEYMDAYASDHDLPFNQTIEPGQLERFWREADGGAYQRSAPKSLCQFVALGLQGNLENELCKQTWEKGKVGFVMMQAVASGAKDVPMKEMEEGWEPISGDTFFHFIAEKRKEKNELVLWKPIVDTNSQDKRITGNPE
ncbi:hypothetical protein BJ508DRAFT_315081 [Ascobolus immersus RN42]|uniref:Uncharacterized protein n=1 Tax=Ascobolus immersus RN42 TaxID=1160509 RepID=A0A3N4HCF1_ASCIM|nr:hypothetical protein BJ508DRAFT_315081 [Ascobolus immersus RN42]